MTTRKIKLQTADLIREAMQQLRVWQTDRKAGLTCPHCNAPGLTIVDRSARPYAEWYSFKCESCGLDDAIQIPMTAHRSPG